METLYKKVGRRYVEVGMEFTGFPNDGIWLVQDGRHSMTCLIGAKERVPVYSLNYRQYVNDLCQIMQSSEPRSLYDQMIAICDFFSGIANAH